MQKKKRKPIDLQGNKPKPSSNMPSKYRNRGLRVEKYGLSFHSTTEVDFYEYLQSLRIKGVIRAFYYEPFVLPLVDASLDALGRKIQAVNYTIDFLVELNNGNQIYIDTKGSAMHEAVASTKRSIFISRYPDKVLFWVTNSPTPYIHDWFEVSPNYDMLKTAKRMYKKLYPEYKGKRSENRPQLDDGFMRTNFPNNAEKYFGIFWKRGISTATQKKFVIN